MAFIGVIITGISVGMFQAAALGTDPFISFTTGLCNLTGLSFGVFYSILCAVMLVFVFIVDKHYIGIATIFNLVGNGFVADITRSFIEGTIVNSTFSKSLTCVIVGFVLKASVGAGTVIIARYLKMTYSICHFSSLFAKIVRKTY